jgi:hypothetical protein
MRKSDGVSMIGLATVAILIAFSLWSIGAIVWGVTWLVTR